MRVNIYETNNAVNAASQNKDNFGLSGKRRLAVTEQGFHAIRYVLASPGEAPREFASRTALFETLQAERYALPDDSTISVQVVTWDEERAVEQNRHTLGVARIVYTTRAPGGPGNAKATIAETSRKADVIAVLRGQSDVTAIRYNGEVYHTPSEPMTKAAARQAVPAAN